ncbi:MAG TPA: DUF4287 domain-containing protein [Hyphomonadaceae bacterium]|nr:DUF4287 domain-containing protein [Hyphomonadaceae bacterium]
MALDRSKLNKGFQIYLANAEKASGKTYEDMSLVLSQSGLKKHGELRTRLMDKLGLGHGHANAVAAIWLMPGNSGKPLAVEKTPAKGPVTKAAVKAPAAKKPVVSTPVESKPVTKTVAVKAAKKPAAKKAAPSKKPAAKKK